MTSIKRISFLLLIF